MLFPKRLRRPGINSCRNGNSSAAHFTVMEERPIAISPPRFLVRPLCRADVSDGLVHAMKKQVRKSKPETDVADPKNESQLRASGQAFLFVTVGTLPAVDSLQNLR